MDRLFPKGALVFEVGAGTGDMVAGLLEYGAGKVVAVEPGPRALYDLRARFGSDRRVAILPVAVGAHAGIGRLAVHRGLTSGSTLVPEVAWGTDTLYSTYQPEGFVDVPMTTLDALIEEFGTPAFVNMTVVSYEWQTLCGLSYRLPHIAFAVTHATIGAGWAAKAIDRILEIAPQAQFNYGYRDAIIDGRVAPLRWVQWKEAQYVKAILPEIDEMGLWGRIHARMA
jgi:FkbM family methyltransferase